MTTLTHKGFTATIESDPDTGLFHGEATAKGALVTFAGRSMGEVKAAFEETIADFEEWCSERGKAPETPCGQIAVRMTNRRRLTPIKL